MHLSQPFTVYRFTLTLHYFILVAGCSSYGNSMPPEQSFTADTIASNDLAAVYIYRPSTITNTLYKTELIVDNLPPVSINQDQLYRKELAVGTHLFKLHTDNTIHIDHALKLEVLAGKTYYLRIDTTINIKQETSYKPYARSFDLQQVDDRIAINEIRTCCDSRQEQPKVVQGKSGNHHNRVKEKDGFSVDKTSNPFSHQEK